MKIKKLENDNPLKAITFRLPKDLLEKLALLAGKKEISRQKLVTAILQKALDDRSFQVEIKD